MATQKGEKESNEALKWLHTHTQQFVCSIKLQPIVLLSRSNLTNKTHALVECARLLWVLFKTFTPLSMQNCPFVISEQRHKWLFFILFSTTSSSNNKNKIKKAKKSLAFGGEIKKNARNLILCAQAFDSRATSRASLANLTQHKPPSPTTTTTTTTTRASKAAAERIMAAIARVDRKRAIWRHLSWATLEPAQRLIALCVRADVGAIRRPHKPTTSEPYQSSVCAVVVVVAKATD